MHKKKQQGKDSMRGCERKGKSARSKSKRGGGVRGKRRGSSGVVISERNWREGGGQIRWEGKKKGRVGFIR